MNRRLKKKKMEVPDQYKFIVQLGKALHTYGVPSYKSQIYLTEIANKKGIKGSFMDTPTWINYVFYEKEDHTYNYIECIPPGELNLGALSRIVEITNGVLSNKIPIAVAKNEIEKIKTEQFGYKPIIELLAFITSASAFSIVLDTNWMSAITAGICGAAIYGITYLSHKSSYIRSVLEALVAFVATIITGLMALKFEQINFSMTILASIIVFIPGLSITTALEEITSRSLVSGTAKLFDALVSLFKQFFGVVLGISALGLFIELKQNNIESAFPVWIDFLSIATLASGLLFVFKVRPKDLIFGAIAGVASYFTTLLMGFTGLMISIFFGTIVAVAISNLFSILTKSPKLVFLVPGIVMLVPGSKAFIGLSSVILNTGSNYTNMGEQILYIFMGIIGGLLFSGAFMGPKLNLQKKL